MKNFATKKFPLSVLVAAALVTSIAPAWAGPTADIKCEIGKLKAVAAYASCRLKVDAKALYPPAAADFAKCVDKINSKFPKLEESAGPGVCPSEGTDLAEVRDQSDDFEGTIKTILSGGTLPTAACGDGTVDAGEDCDDGDLDGKTCATQGFFNGTLRCGPGCQFDTSDCHATRFQATATSIIDYQTNLEWEKKDGSDGTANAADRHDVDNTYTWAVTGTATKQKMTGTLWTDFLVNLNGTVDDPNPVTLSCYGGHCDWRIPTIDELDSISSAPCGSPPCVDAALLPNRTGGYWAMSQHPTLPDGAYILHYTSGPSSDLKTAAYFARAVRSIK